MFSAASCSAASSVVPPTGLNLASRSSTRPRCAGPRRAGISTGFVREAPEADGVALLGGEIAERAGELARVIEPGRALRAEIHRAAGVDQQAEAQVGVGLEFLDVKAVAAAPGPPVQPARIVAGDIFAVLRELERRAAHGAAMLAGDAAEHGLARVQRQRHEPAEDGGLEEVALVSSATGCWFRLQVRPLCSIPRRSRLVKSRLVTPSLCAVKVVTSAMAQDGIGHCDDVLQPHDVAAVERRARLGAEDEILRGARAGAPAHQRLEPARGFPGAGARAAGEIDGEFVEMIRHRHAAHEVLEGDEPARRR